MGAVGLGVGVGVGVAVGFGVGAGVGVGVAVGFGDGVGVGVGVGVTSGALQPKAPINSPNTTTAIATINILLFFNSSSFWLVFDYPATLAN